MSQNIYSDNEILPHYDTRGNVSTFSALASSFSRSAAVSYADAYVGNYSFSSGDVADYTYYNKQYNDFFHVRCVLRFIMIIPATTIAAEMR